MKALKLCSCNALLTIAILSLPAFAAPIDPAGVHNFHQVNEHIYRGAQPDAEGWHSLATLGVKTVVDLRLENEHSSNAEARAVEAAGMKYINFPMKGTVSPSDAQVRKILALFDNASAGPIFVHCRRGADRTGTVIGCYRVSHDHWQNEKALKEAKSFGMSWTQVGLKHYLKSFQPSTEVAGGTATAVASTKDPS